MNNIFFTLCAFLLLSNLAKAQYCGNSGPAVCDTASPLTAPGFYPVTDSLAPFINGEPSSVGIKFENYDIIPGLSDTIENLHCLIDSITDLPERIMLGDEQFQ